MSPGHPQGVKSRPVPVALTSREVGRSIVCANGQDAMLSSAHRTGGVDQGGACRRSGVGDRCDRRFADRARVAAEDGRREKTLIDIHG